ncbi:uncharacterized protein L3040_003516 [Drepanopeziza brunnea f. sp. 'multigermtubi']|uniref:uncharacterized protein n=1 Tax=Drepanopeziza brunnea f. sp. 'multigermtubi' TaxID=698441 RepID=UPI002383619B|nr:hypothetical protein L3040_003516 [Drepanopeziza brunnea f. sp. 'multigermtubi']
MRSVTAFLATTAIAIAVVNGATPARRGQLYVCQDPDFTTCLNVTYNQDECTPLNESGLDNVMTGFNTYDYGCEFYGSATCLTNEEYFTYRGAIPDLLLSKYAVTNDRISSFRCGT